jgi:hypothetical protein
MNLSAIGETYGTIYATTIPVPELRYGVRDRVRRGGTDAQAAGASDLRGMRRPAAQS